MRPRPIEPGERPSLVVVMGPTASGKSDLASRLAKRLDGEIVTADSMQIYRGLDVGTAKPTVSERAAVRHHLIDVLDLSRPLDVYRYVDMATEVVVDVLSRGKLPIFAGGTGMYIRSFLYGLAPLPGDAGLRAELSTRFVGEEGFERLRRKMSTLDPRAAERFRRNKRKMLRALEVRTLTGRSIIDLQESSERTLRWPVSAWYLQWDREELRSRIRRRADQMLEGGWIGETRELLRRGLLEAPTAWQALGYKLIAAHLRGELEFGEMREQIVTATWRLAKRQITWFERQHPEAETLRMPLAEGDFDRLVAAIRESRGCPPRRRAPCG